MQVQVLEDRHNVPVRWKPGDVQWQEAAKLAAMHRYQKALDRLEGLVVARLFELTKMNMSRTGAWSPIHCKLYLMSV